MLYRRTAACCPYDFLGHRFCLPVLRLLSGVFISEAVSSSRTAVGRNTLDLGAFRASVLLEALQGQGKTFYRNHKKGYLAWLREEVQKEWAVLFVKKRYVRYTRDVRVRFWEIKAKV